MVNCWKRYQNGSHMYTIEYREDASGKIKMHVTEHPKPPGGNNPNFSHLNTDGTICVTPGREPKNFESAEAIAFLFMRGFSHYVQTGKAAPSGGRVEM